MHRNYALDVLYSYVWLHDDKAWANKRWLRLKPQRVTCCHEPPPLRTATPVQSRKQHLILSDNLVQGFPG